MKKERRRTKTKVSKKTKLSKKRAKRKIRFLFSRNCFFSHQKLFRNRARRAHRWTKGNVNLNRNDTSGVSCSCLVFCKPSKLQKPLRPHRLSKLVFYHRQEKGDENIAFKRAPFERCEIAVYARIMSRKLFEVIASALLSSFGYVPG